MNNPDAPPMALAAAVAITATIIALSLAGQAFRAWFDNR